MSYREVSGLAATLGLGGFGRGHLINSIIGSGYLLVLFVGSPFYTLPAVASGGLAAWYFAHRRAHVIADTPTAKVRSAAQGYVELVGTGQPVDGSHALMFSSLPPCLFYQVRMNEAVYGFLGRRDTDFNIRRSEETFALVDDTGVCIIDPDYAEIISARTRRWTVGEHRYHATYICSGDPVYVLGEFHTLRAADAMTDRSQEVSALLREWKQNSHALRERFDANADGEVDIEEWQEAVQAAEREVDARESEAASHPDVHLVKAPRDGRPFLISTRDPASLARRYQHWAWLHACAFVTGVLGTVYVWS